MVDVLQEIDVPVLTKAYCRKFHGREVSNLVFCGGGERKSSMTTCIGDSGSPLVCNGDSFHKPFVVGIVVGGDGYCKAGHDFNFYTEIGKYRKWIENIFNDKSLSN